MSPVTCRLKPYFMPQTSMDSQYHIYLGSTLLHLHHPFTGFLFHIATYLFMHIYIRYCLDKLLDSNLCVVGVFIFHSKTDQTFRQVSPTTFSYKYLFLPMPHIHAYFSADCYKKTLNAVTHISADHCTATAELPLKKQDQFNSRAFFPQ